MSAQEKIALRQALSAWRVRLDRRYQLSYEQYAALWDRHLGLVAAP